MATRTEVKVGDVGTVYFLPTYDNDMSEVNFDPSAATTKQLIFKMPGASGLCIRSATAAQKTIGGVSVWGLQYTVLAADVAAWSSTSVGGFHQEAGTVKIEGYVEFSSAQKWASQTVTTDQQNRTLRVVARLVA
jgi:hypothetical protein